MQNKLRTALEKLPRATLLYAPTPLHPLGNLQKQTGKEIFIKRDDLTGIGPGGNKVRSLEFLLGDALAQNCDVILAAGPAQSNLCTLAASACCALGLECVLIHNGKSPERPQGNLLLNTILGTESVFLGDVPSEMRNIHMESLAQKLAAEGRKPYIIKNGATSGRGALGYVAGALELYEQVIQTGKPIKTVFVPGGNGGVAAGFVYGNYLLGMPFDVKVISVEYSASELEVIMADVIRECREILGLPFGIKVSDTCEIIDDYSGGGWGQNTPESEQAVKDFPRSTGIFIENIYTSKPVVAMLDMIKKERVNEIPCILHTGGLGSLFAQF